MTADRELTDEPPLLRGKLRTPACPPHHIRRDRLIRFLDELVATPVTVVVAPAGAGKTSLLADWAVAHDGPVAWLSLDDTDAEPAQFWTGVIAALEMLCPGCGEGAQAALRRRAGVDVAVRQLLDDLDSVVPEAPTASASVLVVDDLHCVTATPVGLAALLLFTRHLPSWLRLVLATRRTPDLPLDRLRARGQLAEVHFSELRFSESEAREMLTRLAPALPAEHVDAVVEQADGLAVGLQLAALRARASSVGGGVPSSEIDADSLLHDYVLHEVLAAESRELVDALLDMAVVDRLTPELARELSGRTDADALLQHAERRGLFVTSTDSRGGFEMHSLARAAFVAELERRSPSRLLEQHLRAARWFEDCDELRSALKHFVAADQPREALRLVAAKQAELYDRGLESLIEHTLGAIPNDVATTDLESMLEFARCYLLINRRRFLDSVERATFCAANRDDVGPMTRGRLSVVQAQAAIVDGDLAECAARNQQSLEFFGEDWWRDPYGRFVWNNLAHEIALTERWDDDLAEVRHARLSVSRDPARTVAFEGTRALGAALAGRPIDALRTSAAVRSAADVPSMTILRAELELAEAIAHRELGDSSSGIAGLEVLADLPAETMLFCKIIALGELAQSHLDAGDIETATEKLAVATDLVSRELFGALGRDWVARVGVRVALARGDSDYARQLSDTISDPFWADISHARVHLARRQSAEAEQLLESAVPRCGRHRVIRGLLRASARDDPAGAATEMAGTVELAASHGMLQTVAAEGPDVVELVERAAWSVPKPWLDRLRHTTAAPRQAVAYIELIDPLTARELDVLRYLPSRLTLREIADELFISLNTLKFHLRMIYRKLAVGSRAEAAERAHEFAAGTRAKSG